MQGTYLRHFPAEVFILSSGIFGLLSWTAEVEHVRLGIPAIYEHILAYALLAAILIAAKGLRAPSLAEMILVLLLSVSLEALKFNIPFRHPKTSDFFADMFGFFAVIIVFFGIESLVRLSCRVIRLLLFRA